MRKNWINPTNFELAVTNGKWNADIVVRLYRRLNPSISRAQAIEAFKELKLDKKHPYLSDMDDVDVYPTDFSSAVTDQGTWDIAIIKELYYQLGCTNPVKALDHFQGLPVTIHKPILEAWAVPANLFHSKAKGIVYLPSSPHPEGEMPNREKQPPPEWFLYLVDKYGYDKAFKTIAYNLGEYYATK